MLENVPFDVVFYSLDWHPENHVSFIENVFCRKFHSSSKVFKKLLKFFFLLVILKLIIRAQIRAEDAQVYDTVVFEGPPINEQKLWPKHCVQNSWGAELHSSVKV